MAAPARGPGPWPTNERWRTVARVAARLAMAVVLVLATLVPLGEATTAADDQPTRESVRAFVEKAVAYARTNGKEAALAAFTAPGGEFHDGQLYVFAYTFGGTVLAHGGDPSLVGRNLMDTTDPNGVHVVQELVRLARDGSGWLSYTWPDPTNGDLPATKTGYVEQVDDTWFVGSGAYGSTLAPAALRVRLRWRDQAQFAGFYTAQDQGFFAHHGVAVTTMPLATGRNPIESLVDGSADVAVASMAQAEELSVDGARFVNIAQVFQRPAGELICRMRPGYLSAQDLHGAIVAVDPARRVAVQRLFAAMFPDGGAPVLQVPQGEIGSLTSGAADCLWGTAFNERYLVEDAGVQHFIVRPDTFGVRNIEDGLFVDERRLADPAFRDSLVRLVVGLDEGWAFARANPSAAVALVTMRNPDLGQSDQRRQLETVLDLVTPSFGYLDPAPYETPGIFGVPRPGPSIASGLWTHSIWNAAQAELGRGSIITRTTVHYVGELRASPAYVVLMGLGTFAAAISGALLGLRVGYRIWGMFILGALTAVGGGIMRDVLLGGDRYPIWLVHNPLDIFLVIAAVVIVWVMANVAPTRAILHTDRFAQDADVIGFSIIAINGALVALIADAALIWVPIAAALSVAGGGILSDVLVNREHASFAGAIYDEIAVVGSAILLAGLLAANGAERQPALILAAVVMSLIALLAMRFAVLHYGLRYPKMRHVGVPWDSPEATGAAAAGDPPLPEGARA